MPIPVAGLAAGGVRADWRLVHASAPPGRCFSAVVPRPATAPKDWARYRIDCDSDLRIRRPRCDAGWARFQEEPWRVRMPPAHGSLPAIRRHRRLCIGFAPARPLAAAPRPTPTSRDRGLELSQPLSRKLFAGQALPQTAFVRPGSAAPVTPASTRRNKPGGALPRGQLNSHLRLLASTSTAHDGSDNRDIPGRGDPARVRSVRFATLGPISPSRWLENGRARCESVCDSPHAASRWSNCWW